jgi:hypothetical protein
MLIRAVSIAPAFTMMGVYVILWGLVFILGHDTMPIPTKGYIICCVLVDLTCLSLQGAGGGLAGAAFSKKTSTTPGTNIMLVGIILQLVSTCIFDLLFNIVMYRGWKKIRKNEALMLVCGVTKLVVTCMVIRNVYRSIELLQGWRGFLITHERFTVGLEGAVMATSVLVLNLLNPGWLLTRAQKSEATAGMIPLDQNMSIRYDST